jgi:hypothetical protein
MAKYKLYIRPKEYFITLDVFDSDLKTKLNDHYPVQELLDAIIAGVKSAGGKVERITEVQEVVEL